jgi:D-aspartate ligase
LMQVPVVLLGANFYTALGAIRSLGRRNVPVYALDYHFPTAYALSSKYVTRRILCPDINNGDEAVAAFLLEMGKNFSKRPVLLATADSYALMISKYSAELSRYYRFPDLPEGLLEKIIDKKGLSELATEHGLCSPQTFVADDGADIEEIASEIHYPCIIKPALSHKFVRIFRQKCLFANNSNELVKALEKARSGNLKVMVQEVIPGFDDCMYVFDAYINKKGVATHTFTAQKLRQFPINFGSSTFTHHLYDRELVEIGTDYMKKINYRGYGEIEFKKHPGNNRYYMIEINARLSTLNILFDKCGVEFTYAMYRDLIDDPLPDFHLAADKPWAFWHAYEDMISVGAYLRKKQLTPAEIIRPWLSHRKAHAIWAADDIKPLFSFGKLILGKVGDKLRRMALKK